MRFCAVLTVIGRLVRFFQALARRAEDEDEEDQDSDVDDDESAANGEPPSPRGASSRRQRKRRDSGSEDDGDEDDDGRNSDEDDEEEWKLLQKERGEDFRLDAQKKVSPEVHAPFFPEVSQQLKTFLEYAGAVKLNVGSFCVL